MIADRTECRAGMTLVEMLVALTATLVLMAAIAQAFNAFGNAMTGSRAVLELDARMRTVAWRLRSDLAGATARPLPPLAADSGEGYFEIIEGPASERIAAVAAGSPVAAGDVDDVLLFTARSTETPFSGRAPRSWTGPQPPATTTLESALAEIGWFARPTLPVTTPVVTYTLYRKQLLVMGYVGDDPFYAGGNAAGWNAVGGSWSRYFGFPCDVSVRRERDLLVPNSLGDLTRREFRFMHALGSNGAVISGTTSAVAFPYSFVAHQTPTMDSTNRQEVLPPALDGLIFDSTSQRFGEDVVLTNVLAFDVRVFDPAAPVALSASGQTAIVPGDVLPFATTPDASGCYVDLGNSVGTNDLLTNVDVRPRFAGFGEAKSRLSGSPSSRRTFDTWSTHYEANGINEDGLAPFADAVTDQGTNGLDDDGDGKADERPYRAPGYDRLSDDEETETLPPYPQPLRGIEVRIRCYEPSSRQVRQITVRHTFVPH